MKKLIIIAFISIGLVVNVSAQKSKKTATTGKTPVVTLSADEINGQETKDLPEILAATVPCGPIKNIIIRPHVAGGVSAITTSGFGFSDSMDGYDISPMFSFTVGADIQLPLLKCDSFGLRTGLAFQTQGANFTMDGMDDYDDYDFKIKLTYIKVPAVVEYDFNDKFNLFGGIKLGYLLSGKQEYQDESYDIKDDLKSIDFGGTFGAEYKVYCSDKFSLGAGLNYDFGFTDINDNDYDDQEKYKNSSLNALISASF